MSNWIKVYNSLPSHPKSVLAGDRAMWLHVCGLCYSNEHLTDGFIAEHVLPVVAPGVQNPGQLAAKLVSADLWHKVDGGWCIHDYGEVQRSADEIRERRAEDAARKRRTRSGVSERSPRGHSSDSTTDSVRTHEECPAGVQTVREEIEEDVERKSTPLSASPTGGTEIQQVFDAWIASTGRTSRTVLDAKRQRRIRNALKVYSVEELVDAVDGWRFSPHHRGENDSGTVYNDLELLLRSSQQVEKFRDLKRGVVPPSNVVAIDRPRKPTAGDMLRRLDAADAAERGDAG